LASGAIHIQSLWDLKPVKIPEVDLKSVGLKNNKYSEFVN